MDVDEFLEHHGVKGQQWGQRRASRKETQSNRSPGQKKSDNLRAVGNTVAAGAAFMIARRKGMNIPASIAVGAAAAVGVNALMKKHGEKKFSEIS